MGSAIGAVVPLVVLAGLVLAALALAATRSPWAAMPMLLDFLLAAGLLRLSASGSWHAITTAPEIVVIRKVAGLGIAQGRQARTGPAP